jgi:DNA-binding LacI/PurR family transcriptional regulator
MLTMERKLTLREFARKIGLSSTQVSNAINGYGRVSQTTRDFVMEKMVEFNYTPNLNAKRLGTGRSYLVGFSMLGSGIASDPYVMHLIRAILDHLSERGYDLTLNIAQSEAQLRSHLHQRAISRAQDGVILLGCENFVRQYATSIASVHHPCITIGYDAVDGISHVGSVVDALGTGVQEGAELFFKMVHQRIGFIGLPASDIVVDMFKDDLKKLGVDINPEHIVQSCVSADDGARGFRKLMSGTNPPTAIFARTDVLAVGAILEAERMGMRVPEDVSIAGHDDLPLLMPRQDELTNVHLDIEATGKAAVDLIFNLLDNPDSHPEPKIMSSRLILRKSVGPAPQHG